MVQQTSAEFGLYPCPLGRLPLHLLPRGLLSVQPAVPEHRVLTSLTYRTGWHVLFVDGARRRTPLLGTHFFESEDTTTEFIRRASELANLEDKNMFEMALKKNCGDVDHSLIEDQFYKLRRV